MSKVYKKTSVVLFGSASYCININCGNICNSCKSEEDKLKEEAKAVTEDIVKNIPDITIANCKKVEELAIDNNTNVIANKDATGTKFEYNDVVDITGALDNFKGAIKAAIQKDNFDKIGKYINAGEISRTFSTKISNGLNEIFGFDIDKNNIQHLRLRITFSMPKDIKFKDIFGIDFPSTVDGFKNIKSPSDKFIKDFIIAIIDNLGFEVYFDDKVGTSDQPSRFKNEQLIFKWKDIKNIRSGALNTVIVKILGLFTNFTFMNEKAVFDAFKRLVVDAEAAKVNLDTGVATNQDKMNDLITKIPSFANALNKVPIFKSGLKFSIIFNSGNIRESGFYFDKSSVTSPTP